MTNGERNALLLDQAIELVHQSSRRPRKKHAAPVYVEAEAPPPRRPPPIPVPVVEEEVEDIPLFVPGGVYISQLLKPDSQRWLRTIQEEMVAGGVRYLEDALNEVHVPDLKKRVECCDTFLMLVTPEYLESMHSRLARCHKEVRGLRP